jgi:hypothetical protein
MLTIVALSVCSLLGRLYSYRSRVVATSTTPMFYRWPHKLQPSTTSASQICTMCFYTVATPQVLLT